MPRTAAACAALVAVLAVGAGAALAGGSATRQLGVVRVAAGFAAPVFATAPRSEPGRLYVVEKAGTIRVLEGGARRVRPFLDIRDRVTSSASEQGLLWLAFDPGYARNRRFYVDYTGANGDTFVVAFRSDGRRGIRSSARVLLRVRQPYANHNGGMVAFGPDRRLYVGMGDGGSGGDPQNRAQNPRELLGKLLRLDAAGRRPPRIAALGLRNPWRFSFDRETGDLYIGDVGQNAVEEIDYVRAGTGGLLNFGWRVYEGTSTYTREPLGPGRLVQPIAQYGHDQGCSVAGGYVYRGRLVPAAAGRYFYGDSCSGAVWSLRVRAGKAEDVRREPFTIRSDSGYGLVSFGEDAAGELYFVSLGGEIYRLRG